MMSGKKYICVILLLLGLTVTGQADDDFSFGAFKDKVRSSSGSPGGGVLAAAVIEPPRGIDHYITEYRNSAGGPVSSYFGVKPFNIQSGLTQSLMGFLLVIFVSAHIITGLHKIATGGGDINYVNIALKFILGIIVVFNAPFVYGVGRSIQTSGVWAIQTAMSNIDYSSGAGQMIAGGDIIEQEMELLVTEAQASALGQAGPSIANDLKTTLPAKNEYGSNLTPSIEPVPLSAGVQGLWQNLPLIYALDPGYQADITAAKEEYKEKLRDPKNSKSAIRSSFVSNVKERSLRLMYDVYGIEKKTGWPAFWESVANVAVIAVNMVVDFFKQLADACVNFLNDFALPLVLWILMQISRLIMELQLIIVVITFPLLFLDSLKKAFLGAVNTFFSIAIIPAVALVLLGIFQGIANVVLYAAVGMGIAGGIASGGTLFLAILIGWVVFYFVGLIMILWKTPKISKGILEGSSVVGSFLGGVIAAGVSGAMVAGGIAAVGTNIAALKNASDLAKLPSGTPSGTPGGPDGVVPPGGPDGSSATSASPCPKCGKSPCACGNENGPKGPNGGGVPSTSSNPALRQNFGEQAAIPAQAKLQERQGQVDGEKLDKQGVNSNAVSRNSEGGNNVAERAESGLNTTSDMGVGGVSSNEGNSSGGGNNGKGKGSKHLLASKPGSKPGSKGVQISPSGDTNGTGIASANGAEGENGADGIPQPQSDTSSGSTLMGGRSLREGGIKKAFHNAGHNVKSTVVDTAKVLNPWAKSGQEVRQAIWGATKMAVGTAVVSGGDTNRMVGMMGAKKMYDAVKQRPGKDAGKIT